MNVAAYLARFLVEKNVHHIFGFQGGAILKMLDEIIATGAIQYVQNYHEQASAFAADACSRITGNIGVAIATSGPGATNLITGIANAQLDSVPLLFITGQDYMTNITANTGTRQNGFQDLDIVSLVKTITNYAIMLTDPKKIRYELEKAYWYATAGRPGAVLIDIPIDVQFMEVDPEEMQGFSPDEENAGIVDTGAIINAIAGAKRPVILVGGGVHSAKAEQAVKEFIVHTKIPVVSTANGIDSAEGGFGFAGLHGHTYANLAIQNADLLIALGARFGQRQVGKEPSAYTHAKVIHVDIDRNELSRIFHDEIAIQSDLKVFLEQINRDLGGVVLPDFSEWIRKIKEWKQKYHSNVYINKKGLDPVKAVEKIVSLCAENAIFTSDVGQNQMWVAQGFQMRGTRRLLNSCAHAAMGYSLPAAIGVKTVCPENQVICFTGDGGLQMNLQELIFVGHRRTGVKCIVFNNGTLGMMREVQLRYFQRHYYGSNRDEFICCNLRKVADTFGLGYRYIDNLDAIDSLGKVLADENPYIIELPLELDSLLTNRYDEADFFVKERIA